MARRMCIVTGCEYFAQNPKSADGKCTFCQRGETPDTETRKKQRQNRETQDERDARESKEYEEAKERARQKQKAFEESPEQQTRLSQISNLKVGQIIFCKKNNKLGSISYIQSKVSNQIQLSAIFKSLPNGDVSPLTRTTCHQEELTWIDPSEIVAELTEDQAIAVKQLNDKIEEWEVSQRAKFSQLVGTLEIGQTKELLNTDRKLTVQRKTPAEIKVHLANFIGYKHSIPGSVTKYSNLCPLCNSEMTITECFNDGDSPGRAEQKDTLVCTKENCGCVRIHTYDGGDYM